MARVRRVARLEGEHGVGALARKLAAQLVDRHPELVEPVAVLRARGGRASEEAGSRTLSARDAA